MAITVYVYVMNTMADWEASYVMAELNSKRFFKKDAKTIDIKTVSNTKEPIRSMGGLTIIPDCVVDDIIIHKDNLLILPGSNQWSELDHHNILIKAQQFLSCGAAVAAICGATVALANLGLLDERRHTSNGEGFLDMFCSKYKGKKYYVNDVAVRDNNLITAGSTGGLLMAKYILEYLDVFKSDTLEYWYSYFSTGDANAFFAMMQTLQ
ncbi:ThiJ/PfpI domain-containing protein [Piromyces finnis]|uniref:D-lactate dehydratase n=1 Tax=Piromyces finnis TaxID=1754191 RepID=A0A1Y1VD96_9FUNG|nr:ThiJ/PfpI domain-containing protein [Piromyces finnis]|eukprot:ORX53283.1 ThiJ/PfpI domain-containing protein [Piromyces finnis]